MSSRRNFLGALAALAGAAVTYPLAKLCGSIKANATPVNPLAGEVGSVYGFQFIDERTLPTLTAEEQPYWIMLDSYGIDENGVPKQVLLLPTGDVFTRSKEFRTEIYEEAARIVYQPAAKMFEVQTRFTASGKRYPGNIKVLRYQTYSLERARHLQDAFAKRIQKILDEGEENAVVS